MLNFDLEPSGFRYATIYKTLLNTGYTLRNPGTIRSKVAAEETMSEIDV